MHEHTKAPVFKSTSSIYRLRQEKVAQQNMYLTYWTEKQIRRGSASVRIYEKSINMKIPIEPQHWEDGIKRLGGISDRTLFQICLFLS